MAERPVLRDLASPSEALFHDALIAGLSRVAAAIGRGALADRAGRTTRSLDQLFAGETAAPTGKGLLDFLCADLTALDEVLALYGVRLCARAGASDPAADLATVAGLAHAAAGLADALQDGRRDHRETLALAAGLRPLLQSLATIVAEADSLRGVRHQTGPPD